MAFKAGFADSGFTEGYNVRIEYRWGRGDYKRPPALAAELVRTPATVIVSVGGDPSAQAAVAIAWS